MSDLITYEELKSDYLFFLFYVTDVSEFLSLWGCNYFFSELIYGLQIISNFKILYFGLFNQIGYLHRQAVSLIDHVYNLEIIFAYPFEQDGGEILPIQH